MNLLISGGREFDDLRLFFTALDWVVANYGTPERVIHGNARGADFLGRCWCKYIGATEAPYPADWKAHGYAAGPIRNKQMLDSEQVDLVVAFPGDKGTRDMMEQARGRKIPVYDVSRGELK